MAKKVYVGNLPYAASDEDLNTMFSAYGAVDSARVIMDNTTGRSKGFGFVEMSSDDAAQSAIAALNGSMFKDRTLTVSEARPQQPRERRGFGGGGGGRGGYGGGGGRPGGSGGRDRR
ncbi:MAG TPA: RNA-binding protein [Dissulfurispiraceae bacterium]|nr:RNA-binding protein [Dissulfurispiraceae bacterium]